MRGGAEALLNPTRRIAVALVALSPVSVIGMLGYMLLEKLSAANALYLTIITLTTVGTAIWFRAPARAGPSPS